MKSDFSLTVLKDFPMTQGEVAPLICATYAPALLYSQPNLGATLHRCSRVTLTSYLAMGNASVLGIPCPKWHLPE